jgi:hypothetical protein
VGRVVCETPEGRLNGSSLLLEGSLVHSGGASIKLDLSGLPAWRVFPGQARTPALPQTTLPIATHEGGHAACREVTM